MAKGQKVKPYKPQVLETFVTFTEPFLGLPGIFDHVACHMFLLNTGAGSSLLHRNGPGPSSGGGRLSLAKWEVPYSEVAVKTQVVSRLAF